MIPIILYQLELDSSIEILFFNYLAYALRAYKYFVCPYVLYTIMTHTFIFICVLLIFDTKLFYQTMFLTVKN